jgi:cytochrome oxidase Cu insertion factor (SCO1/SenC/PrrC family)
MQRATSTRAASPLARANATAHHAGMKTSLAIAAAISLSTGAASAADKRPAPGDAAPAFTLSSSTGKKISLADYQGRTVVLAFFLKAFTGG